MSAPFPFGLGLGGFAIGSGGFTGPVGGFGAATGGPGGGFLAPVITLQSVFGQSFSAQTVADAIKVADQQARLESTRGEVATPIQKLISIITSPTGASLVLDLAKGLFEIFDASGRRLGGGVTPEAAIEAVRGGPGGAARVQQLLEPAAAFAEPSAPIPGPAEGGEFGELLRTILGALGQLRGGRLQPVGLEPVAIGGTVNVPVVPGSTSDPRGTLRPTAAAFVPKPPPPPPRAPERPTATQAGANIVRVIIDLLLRRRQAEALRDAQRRQLELIAAAQAARRSAMPFGQSGFVGTTSVGPFIGGALGGLAGDAIEGLLERLFRDTPDATRLPAFPPAPQLPGQQPTGFPSVPGLDLSVLGGGGGCPPLFRTGTGAMRVSPTPWFPVQAPDGKWFFFGHLGKPTFSKLKSPRRHHHHPRKR